MSEMPAQQGWQCPVCGRVYAPWMAQCLSCGNEHTYASYASAATMTYEEFLDRLAKTGVQERTEE